MAVDYIPDMDQCVQVYLNTKDGGKCNTVKVHSLGVFLSLST